MISSRTNKMVLSYSITKNCRILRAKKCLNIDFFFFRERSKYFEKFKNQYDLKTEIMCEKMFEV